MRWYRDDTGRFDKRPHYEPIEIDRECEMILAEFRRDHGLPSEVHLDTDQMTNLVEAHAYDLDVYADLSADGPQVEGVTLFVPRRRPSVQISLVLTEDGKRSNRFRTTVAHELGHVRLHDYLFQLKLATPDLFTKVRDDRIVCKRDSMVDAPMRDWMEWQACYFSGALLMPRRAMVALAKEQGDGVSGPPRLGSELAERLIADTMSRFEVSRDAARVRLSVLGLIANTRA